MTEALVSLRASLRFDGAELDGGVRSGSHHYRMVRWGIDRRRRLR